jgi:hypothetical protein
MALGRAPECGGGTAEEPDIVAVDGAMQGDLGAHGTGAEDADKLDMSLVHWVETLSYVAVQGKGGWAAPP